MATFQSHHRDILLEHLDGVRMLRQRSSPRQRSVVYLISRGLLVVCDRSGFSGTTGQYYTRLTVAGRRKLAAILAEYAEVLIRAQKAAPAGMRDFYLSLGVDVSENLRDKSLTVGGPVNTATERETSNALDPLATVDR